MYRKDKVGSNMKQAKLTKAQNEVLEDAKKHIDKARTLTYREWLIDMNSYYLYHEDALEEAIQKQEYANYYENEKNGIVLTHCNSRTLKKLESLGYIEIIEDSTGESYGIDVIKVLNY